MRTIAFRMAAVAAIVFFSLTDSTNAQAVLTNADLNVGAEGAAYDQHGMNYQTSGMGFNDVGLGNDFNHQATGSYSRNGFTGGGTAHNFTNFTPSSPGLQSTISSVDIDMRGYGEITSASGINTWEAGNGGAHSHIYFTLNSSTPWSFTGSVAAFSTPGGPVNGVGTQGGYEIFLQPIPGAPIMIDSQQISNGGNYSGTVNASGVIPAGSYYLACSVGGLSQQLVGETGTGNGFGEIRNARFIVPEPLAAPMLLICALAMARRRTI